MKKKFVNCLCLTFLLMLSITSGSLLLLLTNESVVENDINQDENTNADYDLVRFEMCNTDTSTIKSSYVYPCYVNVGIQNYSDSLDFYMNDTITGDEKSEANGIICGYLFQNTFI